MVHRRDVLTGLGASLAFAASPTGSRAATTTIRMGTLRLIHCITPYFYQQFAPSGLTIEVLPFESPTDCKNAVTTKSVDFGTFGIAAATLGAAAGEPIVVIAGMSDKGMAIIARKGSGIVTIKDLKGKQVGIWPGSTQEVFVRERLHMEGLTIKDVVPVRISFSEMPIALARGDIDAYVGAEPAPSLSLLSGVGTLVEHPYSTEMGALNMVVGTYRDMIETKPDTVRTLLDIHRKATGFCLANRDAVIDMAGKRLGQKKEALAISLLNVDYVWRFGSSDVKEAKAYAEHMLALKQIKRLPDPALYIDTKFVDAMPS